MGEQFTSVKPDQITENVFKLIGTDWMLITAGNQQKFNAMTASWGGFGILWQKKICFCVIRPQRYTFEFVENSNTFNLVFFNEQYRDVLNFYGNHSGREVDKMQGQGITPFVSSNDTVSFQEASLYLECRKLYFQDLDPQNILDPTIHDLYAENDYHRMYIGEITGCYRKKAQGV